MAHAEPLTADALLIVAGERAGSSARKESIIKQVKNELALANAQELMNVRASRPMTTRLPP